MSHHQFSDAFMSCTLHLRFELQPPEGCLHNGERNDGCGSVVNYWLQRAVTVLKARGRSCNNIYLVGDEVKASLQRPSFKLLMTFADNRLLPGHFSCVHFLPLQTPTIWPVGSKSAQRLKGAGHFRAPLTSAPLLFRMNISSSRYVGLIWMWHEFCPCKVFVLCKRGDIFLGQAHGTTSPKRWESISACYRWLCSLGWNTGSPCSSLVSGWIWYILKVHPSIIIRVHVFHRSSNLLLLWLLGKYKEASDELERTEKNNGKVWVIILTNWKIYADLTVK